jgi:hypothetical protein
LSARAIALGLAAQLSLGCSYDLDVLKGRGLDASVDRAVPVDIPAVDRPATDVAPDVVAPTDAGARDASTGTCTLLGVTVVDAPPSVNGVTVIEGNTNGGAPTPAMIPPCDGTSISTNSTRVYRYVVQTGPRVLATTNTGLCGAHDTVLAAYFDCAGTGRTVGGAYCDDDDDTRLCNNCDADAGLGTACSTVNSTVDIAGLVPRDVIYFVVASYNGGTNPRGLFRLAVAENGLAPLASPVSTTGEPTAANRCACPPATPPISGEVVFPRMGDTNRFTTTARDVLGGRDLPFSRVTGVSARLRLARYSVDTTGPCAVNGGARAALDLLLNNTIVATGSLGIGAGSAGSITIPFTTFAPVVFGATTNIPLTYRLRNVEPAGAPCVSLDVDLNGPNAVTLYGSN